MQSAQTRGSICAPEVRVNYLKELKECLANAALHAETVRHIRYLYMRETYTWIQYNYTPHEKGVILNWFNKSCKAAGV